MYVCCCDLIQPASPVKAFRVLIESNRKAREHTGTS